MGYYKDQVIAYYDNRRYDEEYDWIDQLPQRRITRMARKLIHMVQYSARDHIACQEEASFWRKDGYTVVIDYRGAVWVLKVYEQ